MYESKYVIGTSQKSAKMYVAYENELFEWFEVRLMLTDTRIGYVFYLDDGKETCYFSEDGCTKDYDFTLGYYNFFQYPYINEADIVRPVAWMEEAVFYQIFPDRFHRGCDKKDTSYINLTWGEKPTPKSFAGGDLPGITQKLDYIHDLGVNAIYLTPVFSSKSNHKYDISDYYNVDSHFGSNEDLKELIKEAHKRGIRVVLDAVFNHSSMDLKEFQDVCKNGKASPYYDWFIVHGDTVDTEDCNYETFASCKYMPKFNTSNPSVQTFLIDIAVYYINEYQIDGWRLDVSDEISQDFWRSFRKAVKAANPEAVIIGENWHDAYRNLRGDQYDSIMNYAFTKLCLDFFKTGSKDATHAAYKLNELLMRNKEGINKEMLNLLDSHDSDRFYSQIGCNKAYMKEALALLFFYPGAPCLFYGTEILTEGGYDPDCRRCMDWEKTKSSEYEEIYSFIRELSFMQKTCKLNEGTYRITSKEDVLILTCTKKECEYVLLVNHTNEEKHLEGLSPRPLKPESFVILKDGGIYLEDK